MCSHLTNRAFRECLTPRQELSECRSLHATNRSSLCPVLCKESQGFFDRAMIKLCKRNPSLVFAQLDKENMLRVWDLAIDLAKEQEESLHKSQQVGVQGEARSDLHTSTSQMNPITTSTNPTIERIQS